MTKFFQTINDYNLCTYYVMPLLKLNKYSFGPQNFDQCRMTLDGKFLEICLHFDVPFLHDHECFLSSYTKEGRDYVVMQIPERWWPDVELFKQGKYSKFSFDAKEMIRNYSMLMLKQVHPGTLKTYTDARLMALDSDEDQRRLLREKLEEELNCSIPSDLELISVPADQNYTELVTTT